MIFLPNYYPKEKIRCGLIFVYYPNTGFILPHSKRIVQGNMVIDHEEVTWKGGKPLHAIAIYVIEKERL